MKNIDDVVRAVAAAFHFAPGDLLGHARTKQLTYARHIAMWIARNEIGASFPELGRAFKRDHTTIVSAVQKVERDTSDTMTKSIAACLAHLNSDDQPIRFIGSHPGGYSEGMIARVLELNRARRWKALARKLRRELKQLRGIK